MNYNAETPFVAVGRRRRGEHALRGLDIFLSASLLVVALPFIAIVAVAIKADSKGPIFYRARRVGRHGKEFAMLKFRKMDVHATGAPLTIVADARLTRVGGYLTRLKLDELPQLWNVVKGDMSMVGPRPEDPRFVALANEEYVSILTVPPGITGLSQLAFAREAEILDPSNRIDDYVRRVLPAKLRLDQMFVEQRSLGLSVRILFWTVVAVVVGRDVAVHRGMLGFNVRRRVEAVESEPADTQSSDASRASESVAAVR